MSGSIRISQNPGISGLDELTAHEELTIQQIAGLGDPGADRILFWDESAGSFQYLTPGTNLSITGTTLNATGGGGTGTVTSVASADGSITVTNPTTTADLAVVKAPIWTTARLLAGNSVNGSANVAFANKFIVQGTTDSGLSAAQFLGALGTGIVKNTTTTGVLSIAVSGTDYEVPLTFSSPLSRSTNTISIPAATTSVNGYLTSADWTIFNGKQAAITLTTTGTSGAATLVGATLNIPQYSGGGGATLSTAVAQTAHGLAVGDVIRSNGTDDQYVKAKADTAANAEVVGIVTLVTDANNFTYTYGGIISVSAAVPAQAAGTVMFLSASTAGALTVTEPTTTNNVSKPLAVITNNADTMLWLNFRGMAITAGSAGISELTATGAVDGSNVTYTFASIPSYIVADGLWFKKLDSNGATQWSNVSTTITMVNPPVNSIYGIA